MESNGKSVPVFANGSLEEAAKAAGIDAKELEKTIEEDNKMVDVGEDTLYGRVISEPVISGAIPIFNVDENGIKNITKCSNIMVILY